MRNTLIAFIVVMLLCAGLGTSGLLTRALAQPDSLTAVQQEKLIGPKPTPAWYWRWMAWRLGEGYAKGHALQKSFRPRSAPRPIPGWAWRRLHFFVLARAQHALAAGRRGHKTTTTTTTTTPTTTTATSTTTPTTTATTTTTTTTTTTSNTNPTFASETTYTQNRPAFTPTRTINVSTASGFKTALANLQAGDLVKVTAAFTVSGETVISNRLSASAVLDLGSYVHFYNSATTNMPAVWVKNAQNIRIYGGDIRADGGSCIIWYGSQHITWWDFHAHDCGSSGIGLATLQPGANGYGPIQYNDVEGSITHFSLTNGQYDSHVEKCSGIHGANIADANYADISHNRFAFDVEDSTCSGGGISFGSNQSTNIPHDNAVIVKCVSLTFVSTLQTGGNCYQTWGYGNQNTDIKYLEANDLTGHAVWAGGLYSKPNSALATDTIEYGRATNTDQNPRYAGDCTMNREGNPLFQNVTPGYCYAPFSR